MPLTSLGYERSRRGRRRLLRGPLSSRPCRVAPPLDGGPGDVCAVPPPPPPVGQRGHQTPPRRRRGRHVGRLVQVLVGPNLAAVRPDQAAGEGEVVGADPHLSAGGVA